MYITMISIGMSSCLTTLYNESSSDVDNRERARKRENRERERKKEGDRERGTEREGWRVHMNTYKVGCMYADVYINMTFICSNVIPHVIQSMLSVMLENSLCCYSDNYYVRR